MLYQRIIFQNIGFSDRKALFETCVAATFVIPAPDYALGEGHHGTMTHWPSAEIPDVCGNGSGSQPNKYTIDIVVKVHRGKAHKR